MKNIIQDGAKFAIKEVDEAGNSMGVGAERFDTEAEAQAFIDGAGEQTVSHGAEGDTPDAGVVGEQEKAPEENPSNETTQGDQEADGVGEESDVNTDNQSNDNGGQE